MLKISGINAILSLLAGALAGCGGDSAGVCQAVAGSGNVKLGSVQGELNHSDGACRNPGLVTLTDGHLLASYECNGAVIYSQLSADGGTTWSGLVAAYTPAPGYAIGLTNLTMMMSGQIWLTFDDMPNSGSNELTAIAGVPNALDEITWTSRMVASYDGSEWSGGCWSGGPVVELKNGSLLWPAYCMTSPSANRTSTVLRSSDAGKSWIQVIVGNAAADGRDYDESALAVMPCGDVVMIMRNTENLSADIVGTYWRSVSADGGLSWSAPVEAANVTDVSRPTLAVLPGGGLVLMGRALLNGMEGATGFATSWDEGRTFTAFADLGVTGPALGWDQYDAMSALPDGTIAVVTTHGTGTVNIDYRSLVAP